MANDAQAVQAHGVAILAQERAVQAFRSMCVLERRVKGTEIIVWLEKLYELLEQSMLGCGVGVFVFHFHHVGDRFNGSPMSQSLCCEAAWENPGQLSSVSYIGGTGGLRAAPPGKPSGHRPVRANISYRLRCVSLPFSPCW